LLDELANAEADFDKALELAPGDAYAQSGARKSINGRTTRSRGAIHRAQLRQSPPHGGATERSRGEAGSSMTRFAVLGLGAVAILAIPLLERRRYAGLQIARKISDSAAL
jgi:hypothetical protein